MKQFLKEFIFFLSVVFMFMTGFYFLLIKIAPIEEVIDSRVTYQVHRELEKCYEAGKCANYIIINSKESPFLSNKESQIEL